MVFVLDASVAIAWFVGKQATAYTNRLRVKAKREPLHVSAVMPERNYTRYFPEAAIGVWRTSSASCKKESWAWCPATLMAGAPGRMKVGTGSNWFPWQPPDP